MEKTVLPSRSEIPVEETWNLESIFPNVEAWEEAKTEVLSKLPMLSEFKEKLGENPAALGDFFENF